MGLIISIVLALLYVVAGGAKLVVVNEGLYGHLKNGFKQFATVFPMKWVNGYTPDPELYMQVVGATELVCGVLLLVGSPAVRRLGAGVLMVIMAGSIQTLICVDQGVQAVLPAVCFLGLASVACQSSSKPKDD